MPTSPLQTSEKYQLVDALNQEWRTLGASQPTPRRWQTEHPVLRRCSKLSDVLAAIAGHPDETLFALLTECARGDELAGRVVLQCMLGKIVRMVSRDRGATSDDYVAAMWCRIRTYPLSARPHRIAANLSLDTLKAVTRESEGAAACPVMPPREVFASENGNTDSGQPLSGQNQEPTGPHLIRAAVELGLIDQGTEAVLRSVYVDGLSSSQAGALHRISPANVRYRCSRAVRRLAKNSDALLQAA